MATPTPEMSLWLALKARVQSLSLSPALTVAYPNEAFTPPSAASVPGNYLKVALLRNDVPAVTMGGTGKNRHFGILQITLVFQKNKNVGIATEIAGDIADHFKLGTVMTSGSINVRVERPPVVGSVIAGDAMAEMPISIRYSADAARS